MKVVYSEYALEQLHKILDFLIYKQEVPAEKAFEIRDMVLDKVDALLANPYVAQIEERLIHLSASHRRIIFSNYKIVYTIKTDPF